MNIEVRDGFVELYEDDDVYFSEPVEKIRITSITVTYAEDRDELLGICRMDTLELFYGEEFDYENEVWTQLWNELCDKEYNTNSDDDEDSSDDWREEARDDIARVTGVDRNCIEICD